MNVLYCIEIVWYVPAVWANPIYPYHVNPQTHYTMPPLKGREKGGVLRVLLTANSCKTHPLQVAVYVAGVYMPHRWKIEKKNILLLGKTHTLQRVLHQTSLHHTWITNNSKHRVSWCLCNKSTLYNKSTTSLPTQRMDVPNCTQYGRSPPITPHTSHLTAIPTGVRKVGTDGKDGTDGNY